MAVHKCSGIIELTHGDLDRLSKGEELEIGIEGQRYYVRVPLRRRSAGERGEENTFGGPRPRPTVLNEVDDQQEGRSARQQALEQADRVAKEFERMRGARAADPLQQMLDTEPYPIKTS